MEKYWIYIASRIKIGCVLILCIEYTGKKVEILKETIGFDKIKYPVEGLKFKYLFGQSGHPSEAEYRMIVIRK